MERETSIVAKLRDEVSTNANRMGDSVKRFSKDAAETDRVLQALGKRQEEIGRQMAKTQTALDGASGELKRAKKSYAELNDEASRKELEQAHERVNKLTAGLKDYKQAAGDTQRAMRELHDQERKAENSGGSSSMGQTSMLGQLAKAGLTKMVGDTLAGVGNAFVGSAFGSDAGTMLSSTLSGAAAGAALGSVVPVIGTAVGGAIGGVLGAVNGGTQLYEKQDDAFKGYVQEQYSTMQQNRAGELEGGSGIAGGREQSRMAFNTLLGGEDAAANYLDQVRSMAAKTNYTYDEITGYTKSLLAAFPADEIMGMLGKLSDTTAGLSLSGSDVNEMISSLSRMKLVGKANQEYLKIFTERGINSYQAIADYRTANGKATDSKDVAGLISKGNITGQEAVDALLAYMGGTFAGLSDDLAGSYMGLVNNLGDVMGDLNDATGMAYNSERKSSIQADLDTYGDGDVGIAMREANSMIGTSKAFAENMSEEYMRQVMGAVFTGAQTSLENLDNEALQKMHAQYEEYKADFDSGDKEAGFKIDTLKSTAENMAKEAYDVSETGMKVHDAEMSLLTAIQDNTSAIQAWKPGYNFGVNSSTGQMAVFSREEAKKVDALYGEENPMGAAYGTPALDSSSDSESYVALQMRLNSGKPNAWGLNRVPYDNYPALLHEGERVLTAREARQQDSGGGGLTLQITGPVTVREEGDIKKVAQEIVRQLIRAKQLAAP